MRSYRFSAAERSLLEAIHCDPQDDGPFLSYADWLRGRKNPLGQFIRLSFADMKIGKASKAAEQLAECHGEEWVGRLPENSCFTGGFFKGLPRVRLELHSRTPASPFEIMDAWRDGVSPRQMLNLCVDLKPSPFWKSTRESCWVELDRVFRHPLMQQVDALSVAFGNPRSDAALSMAGRRNVIAAISDAVDPKRTPCISFFETSIRTRRVAERELNGFGRLHFTMDQS